MAWTNGDAASSAGSRTSAKSEARLPTDSATSGATAETPSKTCASVSPMPEAWTAVAMSAKPSAMGWS